MIRIVTAVLATLLATTGLTVVGTAPAHAADTLTRPLYRAIEQLPVARETRAGYAREKYAHWVDADGDCQDTRDEVLATESLTPVRGCDIQRGRWYSAYDGVTTRNSSSFDVDHLVPLAEAWDSGARRWNAPTRQRYANDLRDGRALIAVTAGSNRSKSDRDVAEWMPDLDRCRYIRHWVAVKTRWRLTVDPAELRALRGYSRECKNDPVTVTRAVVRTGTDTGSPNTGPTAGSDGGTAVGGGLDPRFETCSAAIDAGFGPYVRGRDPEYSWYIDGDNDGTVCE